ncbi:MAG: 1,4-alpha-glucan branching protein GlgB [Proteobacteria bacterium]|nr:MAG: 1,4-alpha-glucan branching protein GlgB [Pseudomonadota bacterium]QKK11849.1 MAG: 1,4-alpha-glucan branching protein GlgB [Pseudomonadota bacterium]
MNTTPPTDPPWSATDLQRLAEARHHDPCAVLGRHVHADRAWLLTYLPHATAAWLGEGDQALQRLADTDFFYCRTAGQELSTHPLLRWRDDAERTHQRHDPYSFGPQLGDLDLHLFSEGRHWHAYRFLGAQPWQVDGIDGTLFATWAPNAERVSVIGDFNVWDGRAHPMRVRGGSGVWELFLPGIEAGSLYKFEIRNRDSGNIASKQDPYARAFEIRPRTACRVAGAPRHVWDDAAWMEQRRHLDWLHAPFSIYEVHLGSWQRGEQGGFLNYRELAHRLVEYVRDQGFTHIELLPITEHPLDDSWGYQTLGYYAPTSRFGDADDFRYLVDHCHRHGIGVLLDWVPAHFPRDEHGLARFDGSALYEHADPRRGEHRDWGTLIFNYGRNEVRNFLLSSAIYWLEEFHLDGLRVDAVASMLYLDYSREPGDWMPNRFGGRENLEAVDFLRQLNAVIHKQQPGAVVMAEESTDWPMVSRPGYLGGLGFSMKWNMGWMHDTLEYLSKDPVHRHFHHDMLTFSLLYAFNENFILPFSHDEVVHGKRSMLDKMPGDPWQRFANLRLIYTYQFTHPGKKLLFMGNEFAQGKEWAFDQELDWWLLERPEHQGIKALVRDLNHLYRDHPALHAHDFDASGFEWIDCHDAAQSVVSFLRCSDREQIVVILNFTPVPRHDYRIGVPRTGLYREAFNSDSTYYGGSNLGCGGQLNADGNPWMGRPASVTLTVPPLAGVILVAAGD